MEKENRNKLIRIISASVLLAGSVLVERTMNLLIWQLLLVYLVPYLVAGYEVLTEAAEDIAHGKGMDEDFLMAIATLGALCIGFMPGAEPQFTEAVFVMLFFQVGELFESFAEGRSRKSISQLMDIRPDIAHVKRGEELVDVNPKEVKVGDIVVIRPGEKVPMDGIVIDGTSSLNTVALTGESVPRTIRPADDIMSGCINLNGVVTAKVTKAFGESTAAKVLNLVENATENKSKNENFITKFAKIYTPIVVVLALLVAVIPPLLVNGLWSVWIYRALTFLVVSCPCALVISVPLTFFGGIGGASRKGVLIKGSNYMETLAKVRTIAFDKTGTMTHGVFDVTAIHPENIAPNELLHLVAHAERYSTHPIAISIRKAFPNKNDGCDVKDVVETAGQGVKARINGKSVSVGNTNLMESVGAKWQPCEKVGTILHIAIDGEYAGHIVVSDKIKKDAADAVNVLKAEGVKRLVMLTGDKEEVAADVAKTVGLAEYHAELLPGDKVNQVETILKENAEGTMAFVGDGINDAPVLARADVGIAMGGLGSDAAIEAADVVLMDDKPSKIAVAIRQARRTLRIARENTWFAVGIKIAVLILAFFGLATMWMAVFADVGVTVLAVLNAARTLK